ncbi:hypothetical protein CKAH01_18849 [Colletotrichum kahawae]|uniref:Uncharacterized protein n=1 Tax=Colletotrichum kahawae TaxID=34407 RepID=A0AAE0D1H0_COLKA|nr:hypothetical protein CKAH01_18849 [Colletotrichum kahawae]
MSFLETCYCSLVRFSCTHHMVFHT